MGNYNMDISDKMKMMFQAVHNMYIKYKDTYGLYDFTDLPKYLLDKLNDYGKNIDGIDALFVDEFQDVDDVQLETFDRVNAEKKFYIGDPAQSIYIFRGATADVIEKIEGFELHDLDINYRSNQEIIDFATTFQERAKNESVMFSAQLESYRSKINCENGDGGRVHIINRAGVAYRVNDYIKESGIDLVEAMLNDNAMILCRKNKEVKEIKRIGYEKVQTVHQAKGLEYPKVIVTDFDMRGIEDINIAYVAMTRAETDLVAANYDAFVLILEKLKKQNRLKTNILF
jgi:ATP-dependent exoDNAse (exonuclease V) beta subunit